MKYVRSFTGGLFIVLVMTACLETYKSNTSFDLQGHRGCRGLYPENTIPAFLNAVNLGVNTLELDVVITGDSNVLISHEPFFAHDISTGPSNNPVTQDNERQHNIYEMTMDEVEQYDVGLKTHHGFPHQKKIRVTKPLLHTMIDSVERWVSAKGLPMPCYNIEIKRVPENDNVFHPDMERYVQLVLNEVYASDIQQRTVIQSFDIETLQHVHESDSTLKIALLVSSNDDVKQALQELGFKPEFLSPHYALVTPEIAKMTREKGMLLVPWTVNDPADMERLISVGIDGLITDYPDRYLQLVKENQ